MIAPLFAAIEVADFIPPEWRAPSLGALLGAVSAITWWLARWYFQGKAETHQYQIRVLQKQVADLKEERQDDAKDITRLRKELVEAKKEAADRDAKVAEYKKQLVPYYQRYTKLKPEYDQLVKDHAAATALNGKLTAEAGDKDGTLRVVGEQLEQRQRELEDRQAELDRTDRRIRKALRMKGAVWSVKALQKRPKFRPLADRNRAVISVLNLKGGVGKTTVTAQLGIALARRGYRVLMIDLDLQGSLTNLFLEFEKIEQLVAGGQLVHHFFERAAADHTAKLADAAVSVFEDPESGGAADLIATSDNLAYAELSLTLQWLLGRGERDTRFLLRKALHLLGLNKQYDLVLIDCPPLVNISCVNALAASDYVLVPVTPGRRAAERVPVLLGRYLANEAFKKNINHDLKVLGVLANRTARDQLTATEAEHWNQLGVWCRDATGGEVNRFRTVVPQQNKDLRDAETNNSIPDPASKLGQVFAALAAEVEQELPHACRRAAKASV